MNEPSKRASTDVSRNSGIKDGGGRPIHVQPPFLKDIQWFLLRGLAREEAHWGRFMTDLQTQFPKSEIQTIDLPGAGRNAHMRAPLSVADYAKFVRLRFQELRSHDKPVFILATSLGAMVVNEWIRQDPQGVHGVVLINTSMKGCSPIYRRLRPEAYKHLAQILREKDAERREHKILQLVSNRPETYSAIAQEWAKIHRERPILRETFVRQIYAASRYAPVMTLPPVPVLLLNSLTDRMVHPSCSQAIAKKWNCELRRHPTAGHDMTLDAGPWVASTVAEWMTRLEM